MDCPSEEQLIRMKLEGGDGVHRLDFELSRRLLHVVHSGDGKETEEQLRSLNLGSERLETTTAGETDTAASGRDQRKVLRIVLLINAVFFLAELSLGVLAHSMGLIADSLDMLADALVYGISLYVVGKSKAKKASVARLSGWLQMGLALLGFGEVVRRTLTPEMDVDSQLMIGTAFAALLANVACLYLLKRTDDQEAHMQASQIFTSNDIWINSGVIVAGILVQVLDSQLPDLIVGGLVFLIVSRGAVRILKIG